VRWHAHGAARVAAGLAGDLWPAIPETMRAEIAPEEAHLAWELARMARAETADEELALTAIVLATGDALARGSTRVPWSAGWLTDQSRTIGFPDGALGRIAEIIAAPTPVLFGAPGTHRPLVIDGAHLYRERLHALEMSLAALLGGRIAGPAPAAAIEIDAPFPLTDEQRTAVARALGSPLTVVTGGPGTGKTSIVVAILRTAIANGVVSDPRAIALAAPTGKAADRLRRSIEASTGVFPIPTTLHRLLGYTRNGFRHGPHNPLAQRLVIVDESSMIDVFLMERLASALRADARLVLLGDAEQLPSVAAGAVFRDLGRAVRSVVLTKSHRMDPRRPEGLDIARVAASINRGEVPSIAAGDLSTPIDELAGVRLFDPGVSRERFVDYWFEEVAPHTHEVWPCIDGRVEGAEALFETLERVRLLCVTRSGARPTGADAINAALHRRLADRRGMSPSILFAGEPLLVHANDYERGLWNGDQGLVLLTAAPGESARPSAVFKRHDGLVAFPLESVRASVELGYATTVHKAQGSEHDRVALLLPDTDSPRLLTREIVYTAITRARRGVLIVGSPELLARAASRKIERETGIADRLIRV
jgi:exodeoxyribonuclease V alpha subunit